jgi:hypothetical protein
VVVDDSRFTELFLFDGWRRIFCDWSLPLDAKWVYFITGTVTSKIKIGQTKNPTGRFGMLSRMNADDLEATLLLNCNLFTERDLHRMFSKYNIRNEWFRPGDALVDFLDYYVNYFKSIT